VTIAPGTPSATELVEVTVDDVELAVPKGTLVIRAAELIGNEIPRFCDHPLLAPVAACRMCLVEIEGNPKPQPACAIEVTPGMKVRTSRSSEMADKAQQGVMEFLLINHPLDCPICDKGGECPLQNQAMSAGRPETRFELEKRTFPKPIPINAEILLDRERCVSCARCTRFADEIAGDPKLELLERGAHQQVGVANDEPFDSYYSGNTIQICPVGALTSAAYRFRARPFDLVSTPTACEHCASGCALRTDVRRDVVMRRLAWDDPEVNEEWNCDKGRFAFTYQTSDRITHPMVRRDGVLQPASWPEALDAAARGLAAAGGAAVLTGGRLTREDAYAYAKFARVALHSDDIDFRSRATSAEEAAFLRARVAGRGLGVTYADLAAAPTVVLVGIEPEDESPILLLRLRAAARRGRTSVVSVGSTASRGLEKMLGRHVPVVPGGEAAVLDAIARRSDAHGLGDALAAPGAVLIVGERLALTAGGFSAAVRAAEATGCALAWVPRRAGERGALDAGALCGLLPGGRPITDAAARAEVASVWGIDAHALPESPGRDGAEIAAAAARGEVGALLVAGVDPADTPYAAALSAGLRAAFVVSLETRHSEVTEFADVVFPVAVVTEKAGTFVDWEGRERAFPQAIGGHTFVPDGRVLGMLAEAMDVPFGTGEVRALRAEVAAMGAWRGARPSAPDAAPAGVTGGRVVLDSWRLLLDDGTLQGNDPHLAGTRRPSVAKCSAATASSLGLVPDSIVSVSAGGASVRLPLVLEDMVDGVVWVPWNSPGSKLSELGVLPGAAVDVRGGA
jgi:NADH-quinone oxidoreductase subunit G